MVFIRNYIRNQLVEFDVDLTLAGYLSYIVIFLLILLLCVVANFITKRVVIRIITKVVKNTRFKWDDILLERKVFHKLSHVVPAIIIYHFASVFPESFRQIIEKGAMAYLIIMGLVIISSALNAMNDIYQTYQVSRIKPIKGYIQVVKIIIVTIGVILVIANLIGKSPLLLLSGIGALSAVFMLVFKDSLLGLVAGIQLSTNDMVQVGDWIQMPKYGADGDIIDISLNTVKIQNFDKTITMIPSYALISDSFINWRGMQTAGGRRIKRSLFIDTNSISFCSDEMIHNFKNIDYLVNYVTTREREIIEYNIKNKVNQSSRVNGRALTNIGVFRAYITNYLQHHPGINQEMTLMVRQLAPTENGLPIEIYAFTNNTEWAVYETVQADIFDHLFAVAPEFGIQIFQNPTGNDFKNFKEN